LADLLADWRTCPVDNRTALWPSIRALTRSARRLSEVYSMRSIVLLLLATLLAPLVIYPTAPAEEKQMPKVEKRAFGKTSDGTPVDLYVLTNKNGVTAKIMTYGATLTELHVPDRDGKLGDVVLGFDSLEGYLAGHPFFGSTVGRVGNRIAK